MVPHRSRRHNPPGCGTLVHMELTTREAAQRLRVDQSRVRELVSTGGLRARRVGGQLLVDADCVDRQAALVSAGATGRPMAQRVAWAAADLADGGSAGWLTAAERYRLRKRLSSVSSLDIVRRWLTSRANRVSRYRVGVHDLDELLSGDGVVRTGVGAATTYRLGLGTAGSGDAYVTAEVAERLVEEFFLIASDSGNLTLRVVDHDLHLRTARSTVDGQVAARLLVGVDLADDLDVRTRTAGRNLISTVLAEQTAQ